MGFKGIQIFKLIVSLNQIIFIIRKENTGEPFPKGIVILIDYYFFFYNTKLIINILKKTLMVIDYIPMFIIWKHMLRLKNWYQLEK
jgi:hypothetical protein